MRLTAFYHVWADGQWQEAVSEFRAALHTSGLERLGYYDRIKVGLVGGVANRRALALAWPQPLACNVTFADSGNESVTINALREYARTHDGAILYAHTKGAATIEPFRDRWRRSMTNRVVANWRENLALLETGEYDAVGCHWLTEEKFPGMFGLTLPPFFGGNFWMATCEYLRTLPPCLAEPRYEAERWIGLNNPRVVDLLPGWPHDNRWPELCR